MLRDPEKTVGGMLDKQGVAMLGAVDDGGFPNIKCMLKPRLREGIRTIYFSTNTSSLHVAQLRANPKACVYVYDRRFFRGALLTGTVEVLEDAAHRELLWQEGDTMYYPQGVGDPDYCVLRFTAAAGRYYANMKSSDFAVASPEARPDKKV